MLALNTSKHKRQPYNASHSEERVQHSQGCSSVIAVLGSTAFWSPTLLRRAFSIALSCFCASLRSFFLADEVNNPIFAGGARAQRLLCVFFEQKSVYIAP